MRDFKAKLAAALLVGTALVAAPAAAAVVSHAVNADLTAGPYSFTFEGSTFTFSSTGDPFEPLAVQTSGGAQVSAFGGFLGIPVSPTSDFVDRGTVTYGSGQYAAFLDTTTVPSSNGGNFIGLEAIDDGQSYYGFAYTTDATFNGYAFNTNPGDPITASTSVSSAPEPGTWALMFAAVAVAGGMLRYSQRRALAYGRRLNG
jgi:hypothetical protein